MDAGRVAMNVIGNEERLQATPTVVVEDVQVTYRVYEDRHPTLRKLISGGFRGRSFREIPAVRNVSLTSYAGEAIGIIGRNGSGKSSLLRAMAGLIPPTGGAIFARTEPTLLGVSAALHPELSGRRNVILGGLALGMSRKEISVRFDDIVGFAGLSEFIDMPLRTYSSGMAARLHFAVASALSPEVLLIDEALSVGDEEFRRRSSARIEELRESAGTVFLVSHGLDTIVKSCTRVVWMERGEIVGQGDPEDVVNGYRAAVNSDG